MTVINNSSPHLTPSLDVFLYFFPVADRMTAVRSVSWGPLRTQPRVCSKNILIHVRPPGEKLPPPSKAHHEIFIQVCVFNRKRDGTKKTKNNPHEAILRTAGCLNFLFPHLSSLWGETFRTPPLFKESCSTLGVGCISKHEGPPETRHFMVSREAWFIK